MAKSKLAKNTVSLLLNRLTQSITTFLLTAAIARNLGAYVLGQYLLAFSYYFIFVSIASQGLKTLLTRELSRQSEEIPVYLVSATVLQLLLSGIFYAILFVIVWILPYSSETSNLCYIMGLTIVPFALSNITEAVFQAQERMNFIAVSTIPIYILRLLITIWCMQSNYGINYVALIFFISETLIFFIQWAILTRTIALKGQFDKKLIWQILKYARTFLAIDALGILASKMDILIISLLGNELLVGLYGAIGQLQQPFMMVVNSVGQAVFPRMSKAEENNKNDRRKVTEGILEILMGLALPFVVGIWFIGGDLLKFIYQDANFSQAVLALQINSLSIVLYPFMRIFNYLLIANGFEKLNLIETAITNVIGGIAGVILIFHYKLLGASLMDVVGSIASFAMLTYSVYSRILTIDLIKVMLRPILVTMGIAFVFVILTKFNLGLIINITIPTIAYSLFVGVLTVLSLGGVTATWKKLFNRV